MTVALVHDAAAPEVREEALISFVRRPDGHSSYDGMIARVGQPASADLEPGTYALLAQSLYEAKCFVEEVRVAAGEDRHVDVHLTAGRRVRVEPGPYAESSTGSRHLLVLQDGEPIFVGAIGTLEWSLVLPDRDLELEVHAEGCTSATRAVLPHGADHLQIP